MIRQELSRNGYAASYGLAPNKFLARVASQRAALDQLEILDESDGREALRALPIDAFPGIGRRTEAALNEIGVRTGADLQRFTRADLAHRLGAHGSYVFSIANGVDHRPVEASPANQSLSAESHLESRGPPEDELPVLCLRVAAKLAERQLAARVVGIRLTAASGLTTTRSWSRESAVRQPDEILACALPILEAALQALDEDASSVRLILSGLVGGQGVRQPHLFGPPD
jgi:DNA polymerase-4